VCSKGKFLLVYIKILKVDCCLLTLSEYSFRLDLDMAKNIITSNVVRYIDGPRKAGKVNSTVGKYLKIIFNWLFR
jgi:hypothetical protein